MYPALFVLQHSYLGEVLNHFFRVWGAHRKGPVKFMCWWCGLQSYRVAGEGLLSTITTKVTSTFLPFEVYQEEDCEQQVLFTGICLSVQEVFREIHGLWMACVHGQCSRRSSK